jgi:hypothetical protein
VENGMTLRPDIEALLQARIDGTFTDPERVELNRLLATDRDVRARAAEVDQLAELIDALGDVDPPAGLTEQILSAVSAHRTSAPAEHTTRIARFESKATRAARSGARMDGGIVMGKKVMWGLAAAAVIALAVLNYTGVLPPRDGTEGTIGAAKRYQAKQIGDTDVALGDTSAQAFVQSDEFDQMMRDSNVRQALSNDAVRQALANGAVRDALASEALRQALAAPGVAAALANHSLRQALATPGLAAALSQPQLNIALNSPGVAAALANSNLRTALSAQGFAKALASPQLAAALASPGVAAALSSQALTNALANASPLQCSPALRSVH